MLDLNLNDEFLAALEQALDAGAYRAVHDVLASQPENVLDRCASARLMLFRTYYDAADFAAARLQLERLKKSHPGEPVVHLWDSRLAAAGDDSTNADAAFVRAIGCSASPPQLAVIGAWIDMSLGQFDHLRDRVRKLQVFGDQPLASEIATTLTLAKNLVALYDIQPELATEIAKSRPWDRVFFSATATGLVPTLRTGADPLPLFDGQLQPAREQSEMQRVNPLLSAQTPTLVVGVGTGAVIDNIASLPPVNGKKWASLLVVPRLIDLAAILLVRDWSQLFEDRSLHILGPDTRELDAYLRGDLRRVPHQYSFPSLIIAPDDFALPYIDGVNQLLAGIALEADERLASVVDYYAADSFVDRWRHPDEQKLRILIQTCRYTTFIYHNSGHLAEAFRENGHDVLLLEEGDDPHHWLGPAYLQHQLSSYLPDLYLRINFLRQETPSQTPPGLPFVTWIQDYCATHFDNSVAAQMLPRDYLTGFNKAAMVENHGYRADHFLVSTVPSLAKVYYAAAASNREYRYDVSYVSHQSTPPAVWLDSFLAQGRPDVHQRWARFLYDQLDSAYADGRIIAHPLSQLDRDAMLAVVPELSHGWLLDATMQLANLFFRQRNLEWVAETGCNLALFGNGWSDHLTLGRFAKGPVANGAALRELYRATRINLQLMATGNLHQRLVDGLLAGGFFLMPRLLWPQRYLRVLDDEKHRSMVGVVASGDPTTLGEFRRLFPEPFAYFLRSARSSEMVLKFDDGAFFCIEREMLEIVEARLPELDPLMYRDRNELIRLLDDWRHGDRRREEFSDRLQRTHGLETMTAERQARRLAAWVSRRLRADDVQGADAFRLEELAAAPIVEANGTMRAQAVLLNANTGEVALSCSDERGCKALEVHYQNGEKNGAFRTWHRDGSPRCSGVFQKNRREGEWRSWHANGLLRIRRNYALGGLTGDFQEYFENGVLKQEGSFVEGLRDGDWREWHRNGRLQRSRRFNHGMIAGCWRQWHENGTLEIDAFCVSGRFVGTRCEWHEDGQQRAVAELTGSIWKWNSWQSDGRLSTSGSIDRDQGGGELIDHGLGDAALRRWLIQTIDCRFSYLNLAVRERYFGIRRGLWWPAIFWLGDPAIARLQSTGALVVADSLDDLVARLPVRHPYLQRLADIDLASAPSAGRADAASMDDEMACALYLDFLLEEGGSATANAETRQLMEMSVERLLCDRELCIVDPFV